MIKFEPRPKPEENKPPGWDEEDKKVVETPAAPKPAVKPSSN